VRLGSEQEQELAQVASMAHGRARGDSAALNRQAGMKYVKSSPRSKGAAVGLAACPSGSKGKSRCPGNSDAARGVHGPRAALESSRVGVLDRQPTKGSTRSR
jgi:hypothetical protein